MCVFNCVYHDLNVCYYGRPMLNKKIKILGQNKFNHIKLRLLQFLQMLLSGIPHCLSHLSHQPLHSPDLNHLNTDHPHMQPAIKHSIYTCFTQTLIVRSTVHLPELARLTLYLPSCASPQILLTSCYSSSSSSAIRIHLQRTILQSSQIRTKRLLLVLLLTSSQYLPIHSTNLSINSLYIH